MSNDNSPMCDYELNQKVVGTHNNYHAVAVFRASSVEQATEMAKNENLQLQFGDYFEVGRDLYVFDGDRFNWQLWPEERDVLDEIAADAFDGSEFGSKKNAAEKSDYDRMLDEAAEMAKYRGNDRDHEGPER